MHAPSVVVNRQPSLVVNVLQKAQIVLMAASVLELDNDLAIRVVRRVGRIRYR